MSGFPVISATPNAFIEKTVGFVEGSRRVRSEARDSGLGPWSTVRPGMSGSACDECASVREQLSAAKRRAKAVLQQNHARVVEAERQSAALEERGAALEREGAERERARAEVAERCEELEGEMRALKDVVREREREREEVVRVVSVLQGEVEVWKAKAESGAVDVGKGEFANDSERVERAEEVEAKVEPVEGVGELWRSLEQAKNRTSILEEQLAESVRLAAGRDARIAELEAAKEEACADADTAKKRITELEAALEAAADVATAAKVDSAPRAETSKQTQTDAAAESVAEGEARKILEAKLSEMERVVAAKQAEIGKVREKARTYLKELNAEKREMEAKMKDEVAILKSKVGEEHAQVDIANQRADAISAELDSCLGLIREKQKTVQMLNMSLTTEQEHAIAAVKDTEAVKVEFTRYKERARLALEEKDSALAASGVAVQEATSELRVQLNNSRKETDQLRALVESALVEEGETQTLLERARKAEAAIDLLRSNATSASSAAVNKIDALVEKLALVEQELSNAQSSAEDAESRQATTVMRLEACERALRAVELRAGEAERVSKKTIQDLRFKITTLESALKGAKEAADAAQRTAAVAARALSFSGTHVVDAVARIDPKDSQIAPLSPTTYEGPTSPQYTNGGPYGSLAEAMAGHSNSLGIQQSRDERPNGSFDDPAYLMHDKQIAVLSAQLAELGELLDEAQEETQLRTEQSKLLKAEVKELGAKLTAAEKLHNGAPFSYLRTIVVRYLESDDSALLPVVANVLSFTEDEVARVKARRTGSSRSTPAPTGSQTAGYFSFLSSR